MGKMISYCKALVVVVMVILWRIPGIPAATYSVGDSSGWTIGTDYSQWAADKTFAVGDILLFNYATGHTVDKVTEKDYKSCTAGNAIATDSSGATSITLKSAGKHYFICGVAGHCSGGMKLAVTASAPTSVGASATDTTPPSSDANDGAPAGKGVRNPTAATETSASPVFSPATAAAVPFLFVALKAFVW